MSKATEYTDGVASMVCGNERGEQVYDSFFGMDREWRDDDVTIRQFAGTYGVITAKQAIEQVEGILGCGSYRARDGEHTDVHRITVPSADLAFCETLNGKSVICTGLHARQDILVRIEATAVDEATATKALGDVVPRSARVLETAW